MDTVCYNSMPYLHYTIFAILLCCSLAAASPICLEKEQTFLKPNLVLGGDTLHILELFSPLMCMKECLAFPVCGSVNIYPDSLRCELMLQNSTDESVTVVTSSDGMTIDAADVPEEYAGACQGNDCLLTEKCIGRQSRGFVCLPYDFCSGVPASMPSATFTIDRTRGVPNAIYSCVPGYGYYQGVRESHCNPLTKTWSTPTIVCSNSLPNGCGPPPPLTTLHTVLRPYEANALRAIYRCPSLIGNESVDHCPYAECTGFEQWTSGANLSCSEKDCYTNPVYDGKMTCTKSGKTCQRWDQQTPHSHMYYTDRSDFQNYCRITFDNSAPWCFTTDIGLRWELCPVPEC